MFNYKAKGTEGVITGITTCKKVEYELFDCNNKQHDTIIHAKQGNGKCYNIIKANSNSELNQKI